MLVGGGVAVLRMSSILMARSRRSVARQSIDGRPSERRGNGADGEHGVGGEDGVQELGEEGEGEGGG